jgi:hypothetical protein
MNFENFKFVNLSPAKDSALYLGGDKLYSCLQPYNFHVLTVLKSGSLRLLEPSGPVQACSGVALPLYRSSVPDAVTTRAPAGDWVATVYIGVSQTFLLAYPFCLRKIKMDPHTLPHLNMVYSDDWCPNFKMYTGADKSLAQPTSRYILFDC